MNDFLKRMTLAGLLLATGLPGAWAASFYIFPRGTDIQHIGPQIERKGVQAGDIVTVHKNIVPYVCDFDRQIIDRKSANAMFMCVYVGEIRNRG